MNSRSQKVMKLVGVFYLGCVFFNYPILSLFNINTFIMGLPLLYIYLFAAWAAIIALILVITEIGPKQKKSNSR